VTTGPDIRRGVADLDGTGDVVSGIVVMRHGENALDVIKRVKEKIKEVEPGLPAGVKIVPVYDRSELILRSIDATRETLVEVILTVVFVILLFLWHIPSAFIPVITIPFALLISFIPFRALGMTANIMSLGGIAIAMGELIDASIVVVEQTHKKLEVWEREGRKGNYQDVVIGVAFLPVLTLEAQEGRLFKPLAYTKNLSMFVAAVLTITLDPALRLMFTHLGHFEFRPKWLARAASHMLKGRIHPEEKHPVSRALIKVYDPVVSWALKWKWGVIAGAVAATLATVPVFNRLGSEFMPPLDEESLFYMPSTMPGISIGEAQKLLQETDQII
jgi:Cu(I)/Ag(I) efflux system membrane protein CusA/SilA